jgi:hypothetical protein
MSDTTVRLNLSHSTLEEIALDASALTKVLGMALDKATAKKLRAQRVALPKVQSSRLLLFENFDDIPFLLW